MLPWPSGSLEKRFILGLQLVHNRQSNGRTLSTVEASGIKYVSAHTLTSRPTYLAGRITM